MNSRNATVYTGRIIKPTLISRAGRKDELTGLREGTSRNDQFAEL
jgi:hypothetical protein